MNIIGGGTVDGSRQRGNETMKHSMFMSFSNCFDTYPASATMMPNISLLIFRSRPVVDVSFTNRKR